MAIIAWLLLLCVWPTSQQESSGVLTILSQVYSNLKGFDYKFFEIQTYSHDIYLEVNFSRNYTQVNGTSKFDPIINGDVFKFCVSTNHSQENIFPDLNTTNKNVWGFCYILTSNESTQYDDAILSVNGNTQRKSTYEYVLTKPANVVENSTYKVVFEKIFCRKDSECSFSIVMDKPRTDWFWVILGSLLGSVTLLGCIGFSLGALKLIFCWKKIKEINYDFDSEQLINKAV